ncbi:MAG TPA: HAMP domain-containing sensor histidine kinase [Phycisphaerae bacterium]|nr:HAMP domain-containing sensor histidine kinase [Phycisphaerae bacterium]
MLNALEWLIRLRWAFIVASFAVLAIERIARVSFVRPPMILAALFGLTAANVWWWALAHYLSRSVSKNTDPKSLSRTLHLFANGQIALDLFLLTVLVRSTGGIESPLAIFYVLHMALGPLLIPARHAICQCLWAMLLYGAVGLGELFGFLAPHYSLLPASDDRALYLRPIYVAVALGAVSCCLIGTIYLMSTMAARLRAREEALRESNAALQQSQTAIHDLQARRSRFMQTAAHRLKSPLATVQTLASLIRDGILSDFRPTCERITRCCQEGIAHVTELLTLARVQDADPDIVRESESSIGDAVATICESRRTQASAKGIELRCTNCDSSDTRVHVEPRDLADCLENVIDNAIKFTQGPGVVSVRVEVDHPAGADPSERRILVHVDDTGIGFEPDSLAAADSGGASVFDAYRRGNNALTAGIPGSGLGLAIVREVMEQAGGRIEIQSAAGSGTQFTLTFPALDNGEATPILRNTRVTETRTVRSPPPGRTRRPASKIEETDHALC